MKPKILIWGASGQARVVADIVELEGRYDLVGFADDVTPGKQGEFFRGLPVARSGEAVERRRTEGISVLIVAVGDCQRRLELAARAEAMGFELGTAVHPDAVIARDATVGVGSVVMAGAVINPSAVVGRNVIVNTGAVIEHDCVLEDGVHVSPGAQLAGSVTVRRGTWIGIGATVIDKVKIDAGSIVGAGSVVLEDVPAGVVVAGVPARMIRLRA